MPTYDSIVFHDIDGAGFTADGLLTTWTQTIKILDFAPTDNGVTDETMDFLREAYLQMIGGEFPKLGSQHPKYPDATCLRVALMPLDSNSTTHVSARVSWAEPGPFSSTTVDVSTGQISKQVDVDGNLCEVRFDSSALYSGSPSAIADLPFIASVRVPSNTRSFRVSQFENIEDEDAVPSVLAESAIVFWNKDAWNGFAPGELLYVGRRAVNAEGTRLYRTDYFFLIADGVTVPNWSHSFALFQTAQGLVPRDVKPYVPVNGEIPGITPDVGTVIFPGSTSYAQSHPLPDGVTAGSKNGASAFRMLNPENFTDYFRNVKPPFNPASRE
jgi:hypothetical protein